MATKNKRTSGHEYHLVYYAWLGHDRKERRAHTVVEAHSQFDAMMKFQRDHRHVVVVDDENISDDPAALLNLRIRLHELAATSRHTLRALYAAHQPAP
jgi:uncharacterized protein with von Willebrand factor type A (vWA) domain